VASTFCRPFEVESIPAEASLRPPDGRNITQVGYHGRQDVRSDTIAVYMPTDYSQELAALKNALEAARAYL
jgi:hypothetical protein